MSISCQQSSGVRTPASTASHDCWPACSYQSQRSAVRLLKQSCCHIFAPCLSLFLQVVVVEEKKAEAKADAKAQAVVVDDKKKDDKKEKVRGHMDG